MCICFCYYPGFLRKVDAKTLLSHRQKQQGCELGPGIWRKQSPGPTPPCEGLACAEHQQALVQGCEVSTLLHTPDCELPVSKPCYDLPSSL